MEKINGKEYKAGLGNVLIKLHNRNACLTHITFDSKPQDFTKGVDGVLATDRVSLVVPNLVVCG
jgi:hypothetical protein